MISIEKNVPLPVRQKKYPIEELKVGESFAVDATERYRLRSLMQYERQRTGKSFTTRTTGDEIRIWRLV